MPNLSLIALFLLALVAAVSAQLSNVPASSAPPVAATATTARPPAAATSATTTTGGPLVGPQTTVVATATAVTRTSTVTISGALVAESPVGNIFSGSQASPAIFSPIPSNQLGIAPAGSSVNANANGNGSTQSSSTSGAMAVSGASFVAITSLIGTMLLLVIVA
ncbi:hypothetical protein BJ742DRAFT_280024 [Cladochytrium replicatum]|nr:hypothetical protein BJ742DRAFT_280024 [Cladochytrium replicatum]